MLNSAGELLPSFCSFFFDNIKRKERQEPQSGTEENVKLSFGSSKGGLDFPGLINYEVFLFSVLPRNKEITSKPGLWGSFSTLMSLVLLSGSLSLLKKNRNKQTNRFLC